MSVFECKWNIDISQCIECSEVTTECNIPKQRYCKQTKQADKQLYIDPVSDEEREQRQQASRDAPEVLDHDAGKRAILSGKQLTGHHEAR